MRSRRRRPGGSGCCSGGTASADHDPRLQVGDQRGLVSPADGDWPMYRRTYNGWGYSPLKQITTENVKSLKPAWSVSTGYAEGHEAPTIVVDGVMFTATAGNQILGARRGDR